MKRRRRQAGGRQAAALCGSRRRQADEPENDIIIPIILCQRHAESGVRRSTCLQQWYMWREKWRIGVKKRRRHTGKPRRYHPWRRDGDRRRKTSQQTCLLPVVKGIPDEEEGRLTLQFRRRRGRDIAPGGGGRRWLSLQKRRRLVNGVKENACRRRKPMTCGSPASKALNPLGCQKAGILKRK